MTMKKIEPGDPMAQSADVKAENIERLRALFPELVTEGSQGTAINVDVLKALVGDATVTDAEEKYGLNWHGKRLARQIALTPSTGTLRPCPEESVDWDTTGNLMIEGDNLEVLKLLQKSYVGKVKMIYIDPPYNTGEDFVYPDDFRDNIQNYLELTGQADSDGRKMSSNSESSGRFHTAWLNMMYPRLKLARNLLSDDGSIWISIDNVEVDALTAILKEVFGPENVVGSFIWEKRLTRENRKVFSVNHDYVLCCTKDRPSFESVRGLLPLTEEAESRYKNPDNDPRGDWQSVSLNAQDGHATKDQFYSITTPGGRLVELPPGRCWVVTKRRFQELVNDNRIWFGEDGNNVPRQKSFLFESKGGLVPHTLWTAGEVGTTDSAKKDIIALCDGNDVFDTPKPVGLIQRILEVGSSQGDVVLDFFAGSGSTGHAVIDKNREDGTSRRYILVQLPERLDPSNKNQKSACAFCDLIHSPRTLSELTKERLRRAGKKVKEETPLFAGDTGFRVFKLDTSNIRPWQPDREKLAQGELEYQDNLLEGRSEQDILFELLLKLGLDLMVPMEQRTFAGKTVHSIGLGALMVCLAEEIKRSEVESLAQGILDWWRELAPAVPVQFVFRDSGFADDVAKTNLAAILEQNIPSGQLAGIRSL
ncbi:MAG: site-specific DNA-methyltransferase [Magnetococcales bacterium]|nr:site-specific DNA-methyltransferase [Magnetococcales bacterium]